VIYAAYDYFFYLKVNDIVLSTYLVLLNYAVSMSDYITSKSEMTGKQRIGNIYRHASPYTENKHEKHQNGKSSDQDSNGEFYEHDLEMLLLETVGSLICRVRQNSFETGY
jgi:hypothetical protein